MPKPKKHRSVSYPPRILYFKPQGIPMVHLEQVVLEVDEYEAIRLVDYNGLDQAQAAEKMKVSRPTCARILESGHRKLAEAISQGKAIRIEGGSYLFSGSRFHCQSCRHVWEAKLGSEAAECPQCGSEKILDLACQLGQNHGGQGGRGRRRGR